MTATCLSSVRYKLLSVARDDSLLCSAAPQGSPNAQRTLHQMRTWVPESGPQPCVPLTRNFSCCDCNCCHSGAKVWPQAKMSQCQHAHKYRHTCNAQPCGHGRRGQCAGCCRPACQDRERWTWDRAASYKASWGSTVPSYR